MLRIHKCMIAVTQQIVNNNDVDQRTNPLYHSGIGRFELIIKLW